MSETKDETAQNDETNSQKQLKLFEQFDMDTMHRGTIMMAPYNEKENITMMIQHAEAPYFVRKNITEKVKTFFKDLKDVSSKGVVGRT